MTISTVAVGAAVTPTVIETWCSHYLNRKPRRQKPTAHISYDVGLNLVRRFLTFAASQTVDDVQAFTSQWVPAPTWVRTRNVDIPEEFIAHAVTHLQAQLGPEGIQLVGGKLWWQWRPKDHPLRAEWIEMKKDFQQRERAKADCKRCMFYIHGGAYYFGSVDEHRYQIQRHARKLQARVLAPRYRLGPQYPFPCGLLDCLAAYLHLLTIQSPETIVIAGDSAGGGMATALMIILRDQGLPLPAGAILLSPWVDLTHSFPSCASDNKLDYVPACGFMHKPSMSWPPPNSDDMRTLDDLLVEIDNGEKVSSKDLRKRAEARAAKAQAPGDSAAGAAAVNGAASSSDTNPTPGVGGNLSITIDGKNVEIKDQIQMYANNALISHPLVSPVLTPSLGGLPPLCILVGGGEMLRDEQIYLAHKAANPAAFPPPSSEDRERTNASARGSLVAGLSPDRITEELDKYPPTYVQLQVWDDLCHVAPTLSFTRPAKYMYRSVAQFGAWALAKAQQSEIRILDDDEISVISEDTDSGDENDQSSGSSRTEAKAETPERPKHPQRSHSNRPTTPKSVGRAGDPIPAFKEHMIRHRVTRYGDLYPLEAPSDLAALTMSPQNVGNIKTGPVRKWLAAQEQLAKRFGDLKVDIQKKRLGELAETIGGKGAVFAEGKEDHVALGDESPPPTAWAGRSRKQFDAIMKARAKRRVSKGLAMWSGWGSRHDEEAIQNEEDKVKNKEDVTMSVTNVRNRQSTLAVDRVPGSNGTPTTTQQKETLPAGAAQTGESAGPSEVKTTQNGSAAAGVGVGAGAAAGGATLAAAKTLEPSSSSQYPVLPSPDPESVPAIVPFKLAKTDNPNPSTVTLNDQDGVLPAGSPKPSTSTARPDNTLGVPAAAAAISPDVSRPSTALSSDADVQLVSAQAVPLRTAAEARAEHARSTSRLDGRVSIMGRGRFESGVPEGMTAEEMTRGGLTAGADEERKRSSWAEGVISEVRNVGSRDGPPAEGDRPGFEQFETARR